MVQPHRRGRLAGKSLDSVGLAKSSGRGNLTRRLPMVDMLSLVDDAKSARADEAFEE